VNPNFLIVDSGESGNRRASSLRTEDGKGLDLFPFFGRRRNQHLRSDNRPLPSPTVNPNFDHETSDKSGLCQCQCLVEIVYSLF
jgi:hypothetical protein